MVRLMKLFFPDEHGMSSFIFFLYPPDARPPIFPEEETFPRRMGAL